MFILFLKYLAIFCWGLLGVVWHLAVKAQFKGHKKPAEIGAFILGDFMRLVNSCLIYAGVFAIWYSAAYWLPFVDQTLVAWINKKLVTLWGESASIGSVMFLRSLKLGGVFIFVGYLIDSLRGNKKVQDLAEKVGVVEDQPEPKAEG
jgi:hypothetical protein